MLKICTRADSNACTALAINRREVSNQPKIRLIPLLHQHTLLHTDRSLGSDCTLHALRACLRSFTPSDREFEDFLSSVVTNVGQGATFTGYPLIFIRMWLKENSKMRLSKVGQLTDMRSVVAYLRENRGTFLIRYVGQVAESVAHAIAVDTVHDVLSDSLAQNLQKLEMDNWIVRRGQVQRPLRTVMIILEVLQVMVEQ